MRRTRVSFPDLLSLAAVSAMLLHGRAWSQEAVPAKPAQAPAQAPAAAAKDNIPATPEVLLDRKIMAEAKNGSQIIANLTQLSDDIGHRLTGSASLKRANEWAMEKMKSYGLSNAHLEAWSIPVGWERGTATARIIDPDNGRSISMAAAGWSPGTNGKIVGDVVILTARTTADLNAMKGKLKNAIVLRGAPSNVPPIGSPPSQMFGGGQRQGGQRQGAAASGQRQGGGQRGNMEQMMSFRRELAEFLSKEGAAAVLSDSGKPQGLLVTTGQWRGTDRANSAEPVPALFVAHEHYALLHRLASRPAPAKTRIEIEVTNKFVPGPIAVYNTVGEIRGSEKPDEVVILGAHLDSWDLAQGTTDNGTGSCIVLEAARIISKSGIKPRRTIRFVLFTGEEQGLFGSKEYCKQHKEELAKVSLCLVHDTGTGRVTGIGVQGRDVIKPILEKELVSLKEIGVTDINLRGMGGSDHASFEQAGVPGFAVQQDMSEYFLTHHTQTDTLDKAHEPELIQGVQVMAVTALRVANLPMLLPRDKKVPERTPTAAAAAR